MARAAARIIGHLGVSGLISKLPAGLMDKGKPVAAVRPNVGLALAYQRRLQALIDEMHGSLMYWLAAAYKANPPAMAADASPADVLRKAFARLARRWQRRFDDMAPKLADYFATAAKDRADGALAQIMRDAGWTVEFEMTPQVRDVFNATLAENVGLIKSIASRHLAQVEGDVMRSVAAGRDLGSLTKALQRNYGVTRRRAAFIARDQNNKATAVVTRARQDELGIVEAEWMHSGGGKHPRPEHVAFNGKRYDVRKGAFLEGVWTWPGHEINCRCVSKSIVPGFEKP